jgi:hypothetical protein
MPKFVPKNRNEKNTRCNHAPVQIADISKNSQGTGKLRM